MKKWFTGAVATLVAMTGIAWGYTGWPEGPPSPAAPRTALDPYSSAEAQRHFGSEPTHWISYALVTQ